ncbi:FCD domain-containing protein [Litchfieldella xinjiangensis]|uniref:FCD domain-containing protein n=1 Tax=Litchfieldella xinjiangensis TaxID=1166948 RepID=UPI0009DFD088|nr:FCD domain-containing protein [Halomonas xinjiangensis]
MKTAPWRALEVLGVLEGLAARRLSERGLTPEVGEALVRYIEQGELLLGKGYLTKEDIDHWGEINEAFHRAIVESTGSLVIGDAINRNNPLSTLERDLAYLLATSAPCGGATSIR